MPAGQNHAEIQSDSETKFYTDWYENSDKAVLVAVILIAEIVVIRDAVVVVVVEVVVIVVAVQIEVIIGEA